MEYKVKSINAEHEADWTKTCVIEFNCLNGRLYAIHKYKNGSIKEFQACKSAFYPCIFGLIEGHFKQINEDIQTIENQGGCVVVNSAYFKKGFTIDNFSYEDIFNGDCLLIQTSYELLYIHGENQILEMKTFRKDKNATLSLRIAGSRTGVFKIKLRSIDDVLIREFDVDKPDSNDLGFSIDLSQVDEIYTDFKYQVTAYHAVDGNNYLFFIAD